MRQIVHGSAPLLPAPLVLAPLVLALLACGGPTSESSAGPQLLVIAVDGMEPRLVESLLSEGRLPNLQALIEGGSQAEIKVVTTMLSPVVWTTVATGTAPAEHGITGFELDGVPVRSTDRTKPAWWNILSAGGVSVATVGWMVTWPAEPASGIVVSDRAHYGDFEHKVAPEDVIPLRRYQVRTGVPDDLDRFTTFPFNPAYTALDRDDPYYPPNFLVDRRLIRIYERDKVFTRVAIDLLEDHDPDVLALYLRGIDYVSHGFWQYFEPEPFLEAGWEIDPSDVEHLHTVIPAYYEFFDEMLGRVLEAARADRTVILLSDHGFGTALGRYAIPRGDFLSGNHRDMAVLVVSGTGVRRGVQQTRQLTHYDILPTVLWLTGQPQAEDLRGRPLVEYLTERWDESASLEPVASYDALFTATDESAQATEEDEKILDELRSLGYIE